MRNRNLLTIVLNHVEDDSTVSLSDAIASKLDGFYDLFSVIKTPIVQRNQKQRLRQAFFTQCYWEFGETSSTTKTRIFQASWSSTAIESENVSSSSWNFLIWLSMKNCIVQSLGLHGSLASSDYDENKGQINGFSIAPFSTLFFVRKLFWLGDGIAPSRAESSDVTSVNLWVGDMAAFNTGVRESAV